MILCPHRKHNGRGGKVRFLSGFGAAILKKDGPPRPSDKLNSTMVSGSPFHILTALGPWRSATKEDRRNESGDPFRAS